MSPEAIIGLSYWIAAFVATVVIRARAGAPTWSRLRVFGPNGFGLGWVLMGAVCSMFWPITLVVWLLRGRPEPRTVFNEKAAERQARQARQVAGRP